MTAPLDHVPVTKLGMAMTLDRVLIALTAGFALTLLAIFALGVIAGWLLF